ncbi:MAG: penicillin-binding protein 2 [Alphaproteobacteria bacterium]|nr:penicillin-binding protein 2 [Alphaproteobacteria bacterium]
MHLTEPDDIDFNRRSLLMLVGQMGLFGGLLWRLQYLQIEQAKIYKNLAEANRVDFRPVAAPRGIISDRNNILLADNDYNLTVDFIPEQADDIEAAIADLSAVLNLSPAHQKDILKRIARAPAFRAVEIDDMLSWDSFARLHLNLPYLAGVAPRVGDLRIYPYGKATAHILGYMGAKTKQDIARYGNTPADHIGKDGIERQYEKALRGRAGARQLEVNARGRTVRQISNNDGTPGNDLRLTIDIRLQEFTRKRLGSRAGSVVVLDVHSGEVLTMVSAPTYDPNQLSHGIDNASWQKMVTHEKKPLLNKSIAGLYAPGSTFKMIVALAALEAEVIKTDEKIHCDGTFHFSDEIFHCWQKEGHGSMTLETALEQSCDTYFYDIAVRTGIDKIEEMAKRFGLGRPTGIDLMGEQGGVVPGRDWKRANYETQWWSGETVIAGIGQGFLLSTPLQLASIMAMIANGGRYITPFIAAPLPVYGTDEVATPEHLRLIRRALYRAVNRPKGTAYHSSLLVRGQRMAGKTGTVQVRRITQEERESAGGVIANADLDWRLRDHALFVGYVPHDKPRYAISVVIEHGGAGASVAAPIARDIMHHLLSLKPAPQPFVATNVEDA